MQRVPLKSGGFALVDDEDLGLVNPITWTAQKSGKTGRLSYAYGWHKGQRFAMHRLIVNAPRGVVVDHINHDPLDNRRANLRLCTNQQNVANQRKLRRSRSRFKGVYPRGNGTYQAVICVNYKLKALGTFPTEEEAARAYDKAAMAAHRDFACLNFKDAHP